MPNNIDYDSLYGSKEEPSIFPTEYYKSIISNYNNKDSQGEYIGDTLNTKFDLNTTVYDLPNIEDIRGTRQPAMEQFANGVIKGAGLAATTFATTVTSLPYGILSGIVNSFNPNKTEAQALSEVYDNPISNAYDQFSKNMEKWFPNYYTDKEKNADAFSPNNWFTVNFLADKLLKNAGFTVGAIGSGAVMGRGLSALGKLAMAGKYEEELAAVNKLAGSLVEQGVGEDEAFTRALNQVGKGIKLTNGIQTLGSTLIAAGNEASFEGLQTKQQTTEEIINHFKEKNKRDPNAEELNEIDKYSSAAGNIDYLTNLAILGASDYIQFGRILSGAKNESKALLNGITRDAEGTFIPEPTSKFNKLSPYFKGLITESNEENMQTIAQNASTDYWTRKYDDPARNTFADKLNSIGYGFNQSFGTKSGVESMILGGLTGILSGVATGEIKEELKENREKDEATKNAVDYLNKYKVSDIFKKNEPLIDEAIRSESIGRDMDEAIKSGDIYQYKNLQHDLFKNYVLSRIETGKGDLIEDELNDLKQLPKEEFEKTFGIDPTTSDKKSTGEYIDKLITEAKNLTKLKENLDLRFPTISNDARTVLWDMAGNIDNVNKRIGELNLQIAKSPEIFSATQTYLLNKTKENLDNLDKVVKDHAINLESTGENATKLVTDYIQLNNKRTQLANAYKESITQEGLNRIEKRVTETTDNYNKRASETQNKTEETIKSQEKVAKVENIKNKKRQKDDFDAILEQEEAEKGISPENSAEFDRMAQEEESKETSIPITREPKINKITPNNNVEVDNRLDTIDLGSETGTKQTKEKDNIVKDNIINNPDKSMIGGGESFSNAYNRVTSVVKDIIDKGENNSTITTHNTIFNLIKLLKDKGYWNNNENVDFLSDKNFRKEYSEMDSNTGSTFDITTNTGKTIHVVRHGETEDNKKGNFRSDNAQLDKRGIKEANDLHNKLGITPKVYSSSLDRSIHTANIISSGVAPVTVTKNEIDEVDTEENSKVVIDPEYIDESKVKQINTSSDDIVREVSNSNYATTKDFDGTPVYEGKKITDGYNALAYLSRDYERGVMLGTLYKTNVNNELHTNADQVILDPDNFNIGDEVELRLEDNPEIEVYTEDITSNKTVTWGSVKGKLSPEKYNSLVPIRVYYKNNPTNVFLHTEQWINDSNVYGDLDQDKENLKLIRDYIVKNGSFKTNITDKTSGKLFTLTKGQTVNLTESLGNDNIVIDIATSTGDLKNYREDLSNSKGLVSGATYVVLPLQNGERLAYPVFKDTIGNSEYSNQIKLSIIKAIDAYLSGENPEVVKQVLEITGYDISDIRGLDNYIKLFIHGYNTGKSNLKDIINNIPKGSYYTTVKGSIEFALLNEKDEQKVYFLNKENQEHKEMVLRQLALNLHKFRINTNLNAFNNTQNIAFIGQDDKISPISYKTFLYNTSKTNVKGQQLDNGKRIYAVQSVVRVDYSNILGKEVTPEIEEKKTKVSSEKSTKIETKNKLKLKTNLNESAFDLPTTVGDESLMQKSSDKLLISELGAYKQESITNHITRNIIRDLYNNPTQDIVKLRNDYLNKYKTQFEDDLSELNKYSDNELEPIQIKYRDQFFKPIIDKWNVIERSVIYKVNKIEGIVTPLPEGEDMEISETKDNEKTDWDKNSYEHNLKDSLTQQVKRFFSDINKVDSSGNPVYGILKEAEVMDFNEVYEKLQTWTAGLEPDFNQITDVLRQYTKAHPWVEQVITKLESSKEQEKNGFVTSMTNHQIKHYMVMWSQDKETKKYSTKTILVNENSIYNAVLDNWNTNVKETGLFKVNNEGQYILDENKVKELKDRYEKIKESKNTDDARKWLEEFGIGINNQTWNELVSKGIQRTDRFGAPYTVKFDKLLLDNYFVFNVLNKALTTQGKLSLDEHNILDESVIKSLARMDAKYNDNAVFSNAFRSGGKSIYSFGKNKYLINTVRDLKNGLAKEILDSNSPFEKKSWWLNNIGEGNYVFNSNFEAGTIGLEAFKKIGTKTRDGRELYNLNPDEYELTSLGLLTGSIPDNSGTDSRVIILLYPTTSDKTTAMTIKTIAAPINFTTDGNLKDNSIDFLYDQLVLPEINRIRKWEELKKSGVEFNNKEFEQGGHKFLLLPKLNELKDIWDSNDNLNSDIFSDKWNTTLKDTIKEYVDKLVNEKLTDWNSYGIIDGDKSNFIDTTVLQDKKVLLGVAKENYNKAIATDMVYQYLIGNANTFMSIVGDPALFYKSKATNILSQVEDTFINVGKRLAADIAPGTEIADSNKGFYRQLMVDDRAINSLNIDQLQELLGKDGAKDYLATGTLKEGTNAQEWTTFPEWLYVEFKSGNISEDLYKAATKFIKKKISQGDYYYTSALNKELSGNKEWENLVYQVHKPVYVNNQFNQQLGIRERIYIKTSAYPLTPELTKGNDLDKIRIMMEKNNIQRLAFSSGIKAGNYKTPVKLWDSDNNIKELTPEEINNSTKILSRKGFRLQQDVPYDELKDAINRVSQADKNIFTNLHDIDGFEYNNNSYKGRDLEKIYQEHYEQLYKNGFEGLKKEVYDESGNLNIPAIRDILKEEGMLRGYSIADMEGIELDKYLTFLPYSPSAIKYEALLNAIVKNRVLKMKFKGNSFVLSTEEGYQKAKVVDEEASKDIQGIIYTDKWTGKLLPSRVEKGKVLPAQILIPWKFKDNNGNLLDINRFVKDGKIDMTKLPEEILQIFGMRIPNQGLNSQSYVEIVGFLPKTSGDIAVTTRDYLAQMGSDFDVDKLYTYMYNTYLNGKKLEKIDFSSKEDILKLEESTLRNLAFELDERKSRQLNRQASFLEMADDVWNKSLQNKLLDIRLAVHKNINQEVQKQIHTPLSSWKFEEIAKEIQNKKTKDEYFTALSDKYQMTKRFNALAGKSGTGITSNASMFNSAIQDKGMYLFYNTPEGIKQRFRVRFGNKVSDGDLSGNKTLSGKYYKSEIISGLQSVSVDNEKLQVLDKLNLNSQTFRYANLLAQLGFEEEVGYFMAQPIIKDYFNLLKSKRSSIKEFNPNIENEVYSEILSKYRPTNYDSNLYDEKYSKGKGLSLENLKNSILEPTGDFNYIQLTALDQMLYLDKPSQTLSTIQSAINTDSKGLGKNLFETLSKEEAVKRLQSVNIENIESILGEFDNLGNLIKPTTIQGFSTYYGLLQNNKLWKQLLPYNEQGITYMFNKIEQLLGREDRSIVSKADFRRDIWNNFKSYLYTLNNLGLFGGDLNLERERLFIDSDSNKSLASIVKQVKAQSKYKDHPFLSKVQPDINKNGRPSTIKIDAVRDDAANLATYTSFIDLYTNDTAIEGTNYTTRKLFKDLVEAAYLSGGVQEATQYIKHIPPSYLYSIGFADSLSELYSNKKFEDSDFMKIPSFELPYWMLQNFIEQYIQHNADKVERVGTKDIDNVIKDKNLPKGRVSITRFSLKNDDFYVKRGQDQVPPEFLAINDPMKPKGSSKNVLFRYYGRNDSLGYPMYFRVDNLGFNGIDEFNANTDEVATSSFITNTNKAEVSKSTSRFPIDNNYYSETTINPESTKVKKPGDILEIVDKGNVKRVLENIVINSDDQYYQLLASELLNNYGDRNLRLSTELEKVRGRYANGTVKINLDNEKHTSVNELSKTVLHEVLHGFTIPAIQAWSKGEKLDPKVKDAIDSLNQSFNRHKSSITKEVMDKFIAKRTEKYESMTDEELSKYYGATNLEEFVTMLMTDGEFQKILNEIPANSEGKPWFEVFLDKLKQFFNALGLNVNKNSMLASAIDDVLTIIEHDTTQAFTQEGQTIETLYPGINEAAISYTLKLIKGLQNIQRNKFEFSKLQGWLNDLQKQGVPKEQVDMFKESAKDGMTKEEIISSILANYSYTVEVNTAKKKFDSLTGNIEESHFKDKEGKIIKTEYIVEEDDGAYISFNTRKEAETYLESKRYKNQQSTSYYSNLTVPGGTNYTENEISTPLITPNIKGHAQFSTDKGIGWFRSDTKVNNATITTDEEPDLSTGEPRTKRNTIGGNITKDRRILEIQSDLFQKGRDYKSLTGKERWNFVSDNSPENQFLQLLNKDNNWVTFFIKSIIQDSAKKGYEKVLFPKGETAAKVEGHETLANEILNINRAIEHTQTFLGKEDSIPGLEEEINNLRKEITTLKKTFSSNLTTQEPTVDRKTANKYGFEDYSYVRVESTYSRKEIYNKSYFGYDSYQEHRDALGENYEGYYIHGYNTERNKPQIKILPITREEAIAIFNNSSNSDRYLVEDRQKVIALEHKISVRNQKIGEIKEAPSEIKRLEDKKAEFKSQGIEKLKPIEAFYEIKVGNILEKQFGKDNVKIINDEYGNQWREIDLSKITDREVYLLPNTISKEDTLNRFGELNSDGRQKVLMVDDRFSNGDRYKAMLKRAQTINKEQVLYKATIGTTVGEDIGLNNKKEYYYIKLDQRELNLKDKISLISNEEILDRMKKCR